MKKYLVALMAALALAACNQPSNVGIPNGIPSLDQPGGQPVPQAQQQGNGISPLGAGVVGAAAGYMLGKSRAQAQQPVIVQHVPVPQPSYPSNYYGSSGRSTTTTTTTRRSIFGNKTVTRTVTRRR